MEYEEGLQEAKKAYPFETWKTYLEHMDQYTPENCDAANKIFDDLISKLTMLGADSQESEKVSCFKFAVQALNDLNNNTGIIETGEREELCELIEVITRKAWLDPDSYAGGDGMADLWREW